MISFNTELTIDGLFTGLAVFGGFLGYIISLRTTYISRRKAKREQADRLTIMEILQKDLQNGLTEAQIINYFKSGETKNFRIVAGSSNPNDLLRQDFCKYLRDLQWAYMIEQIDVDKYRLKTTQLKPNII